MSDSAPSTSGPSTAHENDDAPRKRRRGTAPRSCAECRRLKLRCDRVVPCSSCVKRGCGAICPDGSLTTGQGNRFVLATTEELHEKIAALSYRVRALEDALRAAHAKTSSDPHPLLNQGLLQIKAPLQRENPMTPSIDSSPRASTSGTNEDTIQAAGSLAISPAGSVNYFGQAAGSWFFMQNEETEDDTPDERADALRRILDPSILAISSSFFLSTLKGLAPAGDDGVIQSILTQLPPPSKAEHLCAMYFEYASWQVLAITREQFDEEVFGQYYGSEFHFSLKDYTLFHRLAILLLVFAIGSALDPALPMYNLEADKYYHLARAVLARSCPVDRPTMSAVQALLLIHHYMLLTNCQDRNSNPVRWAILGLAVRLSQAMALHRDCRHFNLGPKETLQREVLFWEVATAESYMAIVMGRPPAISFTQVDMPQPFQEDTPVENAFQASQYRWIVSCIRRLHDDAFGANAPDYNTVIQLDHMLRSFPVPTVFRITNPHSAEYEPNQSQFLGSVSYLMQRHAMLSYREFGLLYLHRSYFARAVRDYSEDPVASPYGTSFLAAYRSASTAVTLTRDLVTQLQHGHPINRMWMPWAQLLSCAVILGSIATRCPSQSIAPSAVFQLDIVCALLAPVAPGFKAERVLATMYTLRDNARRSLADFRARKEHPISPQSLPAAPNEEDDVLFTLGGKTRVITRPPRRPQTAPPPAGSSARPGPSVPQIFTPGAHPYAEYFQRAPDAGPSSAPSSVTGPISQHQFAFEEAVFPPDAPPPPASGMIPPAFAQTFPDPSFVGDGAPHADQVGPLGYGQAPVLRDGTAPTMDDLWKDLVGVELGVGHFNF